MVGGKAERPEYDQARNPEILDPVDPEEVGPGVAQVLAVVSQYTERPDLMIDVLERHDPGFVKRMNERAVTREDRLYNARFRFGKVQAWTGLVLAAFAALTMLGLTIYAVVTIGAASFPIIMALLAFFAVAQGGASGIRTILHGIADFFRAFRKGD